MKDSFLSEEDLENMGFKEYGRNVKISRNSSIYGPEKMRFGNNVRVDDFCILSGQVEIGSYVHIAAYVALYGSSGIIIEDFSGISGRTIVYSAMDDFGGNYFTNPTVDPNYRNVISGNVILKRHVIIGAGSVILPDVTIGEGTAVGAMSLVKSSLDSWWIYMGIPVRKIRERERGVRKLGEKFRRFI